MEKSMKIMILTKNDPKLVPVPSTSICEMPSHVIEIFLSRNMPAKFEVNGEMIEGFHFSHSIMSIMIMEVGL